MGSNFNGTIFIFQILNNWGSNFNRPIFNFSNFEQLIVCLSDFFLKNILCVHGLNYHVQFRLSMANAFILECVFVKMCLHSYAHWEFLNHDNFCVLSMSIYIYNILGVYLSGRPLWGKVIRVSTPFINAFPWLPFPWNKPLHLSPPFNTTTFIKPMNEEEEEAPFGGPASPPEPSCPREARCSI
jgi:hypothetical protein